MHEGTKCTIFLKLCLVLYFTCEQIQPLVKTFSNGSFVGLLLLDLYGHIPATQIPLYLEKCAAVISFNRLQALYKITCSSIAVKVNGFTLLIDTKEKAIRLKKARAPSPQIPIVAVETSGKRNWENEKVWKAWEKRCLMTQWEEVICSRDVKFPWKEVSKHVEHYGIIATNEQCQGCVSLANKD